MLYLHDIPCIMNSVFLYVLVFAMRYALTKRGIPNMLFRDTKKKVLRKTKKSSCFIIVVISNEQYSVKLKKKTGTTQHNKLVKKTRTCRK